MKDEKHTCLYCQSFYFDPGHPGYSDLTPGWAASFSCTRGIWDMSNFGNRDEFVKNMERGFTCEHFVAAKARQG